MTKKTRHVLGLSGGKDSAALAILMDKNYPDIEVEYFFTDTGYELQETYDFLNKLKNLILNNLSEFSIVMVYLGEIAISTELIIKKNTTIFAFLGGTDANYYKYRPNDFLRVETIKWAIKNNLKHYVLGGGIKDFDSLYKSKKAFFPKDKDITFYTGRKIVNNKIYHELCENHVEDYTNIRKEELKNYQ